MIKSLLIGAEKVFKKLKLTNVVTKHGDGNLGWPEQDPFDRIVFTAATENINNDEYVFACSIKDDNEAGQVDVNFGNGYFGTTAISSEGTNASNIGKFEYDVPTGYTALSTKGLNE